MGSKRSWEMHKNHKRDSPQGYRWRLGLIRLGMYPTLAPLNLISTQAVTLRWVINSAQGKPPRNFAMLKDLTSPVHLI